MYWIILVLALETEQGIAMSEHFIRPVSSMKSECLKFLGDRRSLPVQTPFLAGRFMCKWKSADNGSVK